MITINNLHKSFGDKVILDGIDLNIDSGKTTCIIGKSGSGKSVLLKNIVGLLSPDRGLIKMDGQVISEQTQNGLFKIRKNIGYVFQGAALFDSYTVFENVVLREYENGNRNLESLDREAQKVLSAVGLLPKFSECNTKEYKNEWKILRDKKPSDLSGGMRKRVGVARALVGSPKYIFYDEPTTGLDPVTSEQIDDLINELANTLDITSIVITHDMFSVYRIANKVAMLNNGKIIFDGTADQLRSSSDNIISEFIERFN
ncbi:ATP-binding cassette domain-containing protein [Candidatus Kapabacteria bacterium]|nr:ATP-binding cassette domain-containing protein [Candidatus Kapabacteria bacterium]